MKPGIHAITPVDYYADNIAEEPSLNATVAKLLISASPRHAWTAHPRLNPAYEDTVDKKFDVGSAAHEVWLLGRDDLVHVVEAKDWKTKLAQEVRDRARAEGLIPLLTHQWQEVSAMLTALREQLPGIEADPPLFQGGKPEQTLVWRDHGVLCRARVDYLHDDYTAVDDLKSAGRSANPFVWTKSTMWGIGADVQVVFNSRGVEAVTGVKPQVRFVVCETKPPYAISVVSLAPSALELAEAKVDATLEKWKRCLETDTWPAYPRQVCYADAPPWHEAEFLTQQALEEEAAAA